MSDIEDKINSILGNPDELKRITQLAASIMGDPSPDSAGQPEKSGGMADAGLNPELIARLGSLMSSGESDSTALLNAMAPYMSEPRREKLKKAMRFARMAKLAGAMFGEMGDKRDV